MICGHIQSSPASASRRLPPKIIILAYIDQFLFQTCCHRVWRHTALLIMQSLAVALAQSRRRDFTFVHHPVKFGLRQLSFSSVIRLDLSWAGTFKFFSQTSSLASTRCLHVLLLVLQPSCNSPACCFHVLRADSIAVATAVTPSTRCAWSVLLPAVGYVLLFLGSWVPSLAVSFLLISRCRCHFSSTE